jgi:hypothetical protein
MFVASKCKSDENLKKVSGNWSVKLLQMNGRKIHFYATRADVWLHKPSCVCYKWEKAVG